VPKGHAEPPADAHSAIDVTGLAPVTACHLKGATAPTRAVPPAPRGLA
jgi:hypothetical protein